MPRKRLSRRTPLEPAREETLAELSEQLRGKSPNGHRIETFDDSHLMENLHLANAHYDRNLTGRPASDRKVLGSFYAFCKRMVRKLVGWYVEPALESQRLFNAYAVRSVNEMKRYLDHLQINEDILSTIIHRDLSLFRSNILFINRYLERRMLDFESEIGVLRSRESTGAGTPVGDNGGKGGEFTGSLDVLALEQRVHGSPRIVRDRQQVYLPFFRDCSDVLAVGCGRGELLQLFSEQGIGAKGIDTNPTLVDYCRDNELDVVRVDPVEYLEACEDGSLDGIVLSRFAGHQPPARLLRMLSLCRAKLAEEAALVIETPNPFSLYAVASYALDDSSRMHPLHPETLKLLCVSYGFREPSVMFLNPLPPEESLEELQLTASGALLDPRQQELFHQVNENFGRINRILFSHSDYSVVARRGPREAG
ncbi:MAG: class I SAM-dependent methyltransferase [Actinobacteria bacterium]|nr:class I SAM-dependent methyltransferase [Actinomycetota bacterium]MBU1942431.1 class I SAM-dependent methyltransferase [Actinomycetota bacterium]MBU2686303.1 class I SAM-dependent methyltransferase [Actinomycetota bacterium]